MRLKKVTAMVRFSQSLMLVSVSRPRETAAPPGAHAHFRSVVGQFARGVRLTSSCIRS